MKKAICFGINDYPGSENDLSQCVNDAKDWRQFFESMGYDAYVFINSQVTIPKF